jgi:hypothetical protein
MRLPSRYDQFVSRFVPGGTKRVPNESWETKPLLNCFRSARPSGERAPGVATAASEAAFAAGRADRERARLALAILNFF